VTSASIKRGYGRPAGQPIGVHLEPLLVKERLVEQLEALLA